jgi:hypothetical protein
MRRLVALEKKKTPGISTREVFPAQLRLCSETTVDQKPSLDDLDGTAYLPYSCDGCLCDGVDEWTEEVDVTGWGTLSVERFKAYTSTSLSEALRA